MRKLLWTLRRRKAVRDLYQAVEAYEWLKRWRANEARWLDQQIAANTGAGGYQFYDPQGQLRTFAQWPLNILIP